MNRKQISLFSLLFAISFIKINAHKPVDMSRFRAAHEQASADSVLAWQWEGLAVGALVALTREGRAYQDAFDRCAPTVTCGTDIAYKQAGAALKSTNSYQRFYSPILQYAHYQNDKEIGLEYILRTQQIQADCSANVFDLMREALERALHRKSELTSPKSKEEIEGRDRAFNELTDLINAEEERYQQQNNELQK